MSYLEIKDLFFQAGSKQILKNVNVSVEKGEFVTFLGPSGSGKTSVLMSVAGFNTPTAGSISLKGSDITHVHARERNFGIVFQNYALFPHYSVEENILFPLRLRKVGSEAMRMSLRHVVDLVDLGDHLGKLPRQLSGGQQQRVALARALAFSPDVILLDEPLSALDVQLRARMQGELSRIHRETGATIINVTHDQEEALSVSNRVVLMDHGEIVEAGTPYEMYHAPKTAFTAEFLGESNILGAAAVATAMQRWDSAARERLAGLVANCAMLAIKPENLAIYASGADHRIVASGKIVETRFVGSATHLKVRTDIGEIKIKSSAAVDRGAAYGDDVDVHADLTAFHGLIEGR